MSSSSTRRRRRSRISRRWRSRTINGLIITEEQSRFLAETNRKFYIGLAVYLAAILAGMAQFGDPSPPSDAVLAAAEPEAERRLALTLACAAFTVYWVVTSVLRDAPPDPVDDSWTFLPACPAGRFVWLTININAAQLCECSNGVG